MFFLLISNKFSEDSFSGRTDTIKQFNTDYRYRSHRVRHDWSDLAVAVAQVQSLIREV